LDLFIPLLNSDVSLLVIDNRSTDRTHDVVHAAIEANPQHEIRYLRNKANIGGDANFLRCIESAETEWVWLFGDDDEPTPNSIGAVLAKIREYPGAFSMNFETSLSIENEKTRRTTDLVSRNYDELLNNMF
jgi:GT2 family glycosyltransferase